jgi:hypothetical protein
MLGAGGGDELFGGNNDATHANTGSRHDRLPSVARHCCRARCPPAGGSQDAAVTEGRSWRGTGGQPMPARYESYNLMERPNSANVFNMDFPAQVDCGRPMAQLKQAHDGAHAQSLINRMLALDIKFTLADNVCRRSRDRRYRGRRWRFRYCTMPWWTSSATLPPDFASRHAPALLLQGSPPRFSLRQPSPSTSTVRFHRHLAARQHAFAADGRRSLAGLRKRHIFNDTPAR